MRLASRCAQTWVTYGDVHQDGTGGRSWLDAACRQSRELDAILAEARPDGRLRRAVVIGMSNTAVFTSSDAYDETLGLLAEAGFDEICVHWPRGDGRGVPAGAINHVLERTKHRDTATRQYALRHAFAATSAPPQRGVSNAPG
jgi:hypothetical protein